MFSQEEENLIINLHESLGNRWAQIAAQLPGRTDNEIKNFWNSCLKKKLTKQGIDPNTHKPMIIVNNEQEPLPNNINIDYEKLLILEQQPKQAYGQYSNTVAPAVLVKENNNSNNVGGKLQQVYDPFFLPEFQANVDPHGYSYSDFTSSCCQQIINPGNFGLFNSMPDLANFESSTSGKGNVVIEDKFDSCMSFEYGVNQIQEHGSQGFSDHYPMTSSLSDQLPLITAGPNMQDDAPLFHQI
ncbi:hypothetical protein ABFS83_09G015400 [Erythranthe nasuta]